MPAYCLTGVLLYLFLYSMGGSPVTFLNTVLNAFVSVPGEELPVDRNAFGHTVLKHPFIVLFVQLYFTKGFASLYC